ncbi:MAG: universal stress protein [Cyanobacteria bacterium]|jgi:Kef-type K+ transport system membrane component KefB/nucleotide-binding universal stress UspA family protein|nr:universal stress protein [Cyanobacteria bacterium GSL.Bin21]
MWSNLIESPVFTFTILLLVVLIVPPIFERLKLPGLVGLIVAGIALGSDGLGFLDSESETMKLLSDVGKIYLMFVAGLEIDLNEFRKAKGKALGFGMTTFLFPLLTGILVSSLFGYGINAAVLMGSLMASHTLLGYPIVTRLGVERNPAVVATIGATIFTDIASLLLLAICLSIHQGNFSTASLILQLIALGIYATLVLFGLDWAGKFYFRRTGEEESNQFLFILLAVFLTAVGAQLIQVDKIVGAFLAGLAVNDVVGRSQVEEKITFVGSTLFIPFFFVDMGLILDLSSLRQTLTGNLAVTAALVGGLFLSKGIAAAIAQWSYGYTPTEGFIMWSLSLPQVAATLAAALAGLNQGLLDRSLFNAVIMLMLVTAMAGPILTQRFGRQLQSPRRAQPLRSLTIPETFVTYPPSRVLVSISNPNTKTHLVETAALLARQGEGKVISLAVVVDGMATTDDIGHAQSLLEETQALSNHFDVSILPVLRLDDNIAQGITRTAREHGATWIVIGWSPTTLRERLLGKTIDHVFWTAHCPVVVMNLHEDPTAIKRILVPVENLSPPSWRTIEFAQLIAQNNQAAVTLLHVVPWGESNEEMEAFEEALKEWLLWHNFHLPIQIQTMVHDHIPKAIIEVAQDYDLTVLRALRRQTAGGLAVSDITTEIVADLQGSLVLVAEPLF